MRFCLAQCADSASFEWGAFYTSTSGDTNEDNWLKMSVTAIREMI